MDNNENFENNENTYNSTEEGMIKNKKGETVSSDRKIWLKILVLAIVIIVLTVALSYIKSLYYKSFDMNGQSLNTKELYKKDIDTISKVLEEKGNVTDNSFSEKSKIHYKTVEWKKEKVTVKYENGIQESIEIIPDPKIDCEDPQSVIEAIGILDDNYPKYVSVMKNDSLITFGWKDLYDFKSVECTADTADKNHAVKITIK